MISLTYNKKFAFGSDGAPKIRRRAIVAGDETKELKKKFENSPFFIKTNSRFNKRH